MVEKKENVTESDKIWEEIKNLPIDMFALPNQCVKHHAQRMKVSPNDVFLKLKSSAVIAALESTLASVRGRKYVLEVTEGYVIVKRGIPDLVIPKAEPSEK